MDIVKVSSKFQVVIPRRLRELLGIKPGQRMQVLIYNNHLEFVPLKPLKQARRFLSGIDTTVRRQKDRV